MSNFDELMCTASFMGHNQHTFFILVPSSSRRTLITKNHVSTQMFSFSLLAHQSPWERSSCHTLNRVSSTMWIRRASAASSSYPWLTVQVLHFITPVAACSHLHTGRWLESFPHREKMVHCVITLGMSGPAVPCLHNSKLSTQAPFSSHYMSLQTKQNWISFTHIPHWQYVLNDVDVT